MFHAFHSYDHTRRVETKLLTVAIEQYVGISRREGAAFNNAECRTQKPKECSTISGVFMDSRTSAAISSAFVSSAQWAEVEHVNFGIPDILALAFRLRDRTRDYACPRGPKTLAASFVSRPAISDKHLRWCRSRRRDRFESEPARVKSRMHTHQSKDSRPVCSKSPLCQQPHPRE